MELTLLPQAESGADDIQVPLDRRPVLSVHQADRLAELFKNFSNTTRLRLLHALVRDGEICVTELARVVGMKPQAVSNQLQRLVDRGILTSRRGGNNVLYRIVDPCVRVLLERGLCLLECPETCGHPITAGDDVTSGEDLSPDSGGSTEVITPGQ